MSSTSDAATVAANAFWGRADLREAITDALVILGKDPRAQDAVFTVDELAPLDQFHGGGIASTRRLAALAGATALHGASVVDVGGGLGGPARVLAAEHACRVTSVDITESYVAAGSWLTALTGLSGSVSHVVGDALALPVASASADVVWMLNAGMGIADKRRLYEEAARVLRPGGLFLLQEPMAGPGPGDDSGSGAAAGLVFPVMWADGPGESFLATPADAAEGLRAAGFATLAWDDCTDEVGGTAVGAPAAAAAPALVPGAPDVSIQRIVKGGPRLEAIVAAGRRNRAERRVVMVQAVLQLVEGWEA